MRCDRMKWGRGEVVWKVDVQPFIRFARYLEMNWA